MYVRISQYNVSLLFQRFCNLLYTCTHRGKARELHMLTLKKGVEAVLSTKAALLLWMHTEHLLKNSYTHIALIFMPT